MKLDYTQQQAAIDSAIDSLRAVSNSVSGTLEAELDEILRVLRRFSDREMVEKWANRVLSGDD